MKTIFITTLYESVVTLAGLMTPKSLVAIMLSLAWIELASLTLHAAEVPIQYELTQSGQVSAAVYDAQGRMVRELTRAESVQSGKRAFAWDGLDRDGKPVPAGDYKWRALQTQGLRSEYLMSVGTSVGERWWPGNHDGPAVLAAAGDSFIVGAMPEGPPLLTRCGLDGKVIWEREQFEPARIPYDVAIGGGKAFYLQDNGKVFVLDLATGKPIGTPLPALFPVRTFVFGKGSAGADETAVPLAAFDAKLGAGWETTDGMKQTDGGVTCNALEPRVFECVLPNGQYLLRYHYGDDAQPTTLVEVQPNGLEAYPGHYTEADKMAWWQLPPSAAAAKTPPIFLPQIYQLPRATPVTDGRLRIKFIPESPRAKPKSAHWGLRKIEVIAMADRIAADDATLLLSSKGAGKLMWLDSTTGATLDTMPLADVRDIALGPQHAVFALLKDSVVSFSRESKQPQVRVTGVREPVAFDVDAKTGGIVVAEGGAAQQVKCFDAAGTLKATHGREGGRKLGRYEPRDFASLAGIAVDGHGGFVAIERFDVPRRTVHFNAQGEVLKEWFGGMDFYAQTEIDPADPTLGWLRQDDERVVQVKLDYTKREWRPIASYRWTELWNPQRRSVDDPLYQSRSQYGPWLQRNPTFHRMHCLRRDLDGDGKPELLITFTSLPLLLVHDEERDMMRPLAALGMVSRECWAADKPVLPLDQLPAAWVEAIRLAGGEPSDAKTRIKYASYAWADENGDGLIDARELRLTEAHRDASSPGQWLGGMCVNVDAELNAWIGSGATDLNGLYSVFKPERFTSCGAPVWPLKGVAGPKTAQRGETASMVRADDGGSFLLLLGNGDGTKASNAYDVATHGWAFPSVLQDGNALMRLDPQGQRLWQSGPKAARFPHPRGQLHGAWHLMGVVRDCIAVGDWVEQPCEFWTTDGLYVGGLFDGRDPRDGHDLSQSGSPPDRRYTWLGIKSKRIGVNNFDEHSLLAADDFRTGGEVSPLPDGSVVFLGQGANNNPCYRITGFDNWQRSTGKITIKSPVASPAQNGTGLKAEYFATPDLTGPATTRADERLWFGINKPWPADAPKENFSVRWTGFLEPRFTESYCLSIYARGDFKLWLDGQEVQWAEQDYPRDREIRKGHSMPIPLRSGKRVSIKIDYLAVPMNPKSPMPSPSFHLNWESLTQPVEHVPTAALSPQ